MTRTKTRYFSTTLGVHACSTLSLAVVKQIHCMCNMNYIKIWIKNWTCYCSYQLILDIGLKIPKPPLKRANNRRCKCNSNITQTRILFRFSLHSHPLYIVHWNFKFLCGKGCSDPISVGVSIKKPFCFVFWVTNIRVLIQSLFLKNISQISVDCDCNAAGGCCQLVCF